MITIQRASTNTVVLTLLEKTQVDPAAYVFELTNDFTGDVKTFTAQDISPAPTRYNMFSIKEDVADNEDLYNGIVNLPLTGFYHYKVYAVADSSTPDVNDHANLVETGKVLVTGNDTTPTTYTDGETKDTAVYDG